MEKQKRTKADGKRMLCKSALLKYSVRMRLILYLPNINEFVNNVNKQNYSKKQSESAVRLIPQLIIKLD